MEQWVGTLVTIALTALGFAWRISRMNSAIESNRENILAINGRLDGHDAKIKNVNDQVQALIVNEANFGGMLSNIETRLVHIQNDIKAGDVGSSQIFDLKLEKQSSELINKFREMLDETRQRDERGDRGGRSRHETRD